MLLYELFDITESVKIHRDNPGGDWLKYKQEDAMERYAPYRRGIPYKGLSGAATAWARNVLLPVSEVSKVEGVMNERRAPGDPQFDALMAKVQAEGFHPEYSVFVEINHLGEPWINEGNTRTAVAKALGIEYIPVDIQWMNGAEEVDGPWSPENVKRMAG